jgi:hypothetical protein
MLKGEKKAFPPLTIPGFVAFKHCKNRNLERGYYISVDNRSMNTGYALHLLQLSVFFGICSKPTLSLEENFYAIH